MRYTRSPSRSLNTTRPGGSTVTASGESSDQPIAGAENGGGDADTEVDRGDGEGRDEQPHGDGTSQLTKDRTSVSAEREESYGWSEGEE